MITKESKTSLVNSKYLSVFATFSLLAGILCAGIAQAAIDRVIAPAVKSHRYIEHGTISGGEAGSIHTLLNLRRILAPKDKIERLVIDLGDDKGKPLTNKVSYFQVSLEKDSPRVVIDLSQMSASGVDQKKLTAIFSSSRMVKNPKINFDPVDQTITLKLDLKKKVQIEAFKIQPKGKPSKIVIDLKELI